MRNVLATTMVVTGASLLGLLLTACGSSVDVLRLTQDTFPPKASADEVEILDEAPTRPHIPLADLSLTDTDANAGKMQRKILKKAATLGADAVAFSKPESHVEQHVAYNSPMYCGFGYPGMGMGWGSPWGMGMGGMGWGSPWGMGWGSPWGMGGMGWGAGNYAVPYDVTVTTVKGTAIRYTEP